MTAFDDDPCRCAAEMMHQLLDDELDEAMALQLRHHLDACAGCVETYDLEVVVRSTLQRCCQEQAPASLRARIVTLRVRRD